MILYTSFQINGISNFDGFNHKICTFHTYFSKKQCCFWNWKKKWFLEWSILVTSSVILVMFSFWRNKSKLNGRKKMFCVAYTPKVMTRNNRNIYIFLHLHTFEFIFFDKIHKWILKYKINELILKYSLYILQKLAIGFLRQRRTLCFWGNRNSNIYRKSN